MAQGALVHGEIQSTSAIFEGASTTEVALAAIVLHPDVAPAHRPLTVDVRGATVHYLRSSTAGAGLHGEGDLVKAPAAEEKMESFDFTGTVRIEASVKTHVRVLAQNPQGSFAGGFDAAWLRVVPGPDEMLHVDDDRGAPHAVFDRNAWPHGRTVSLFANVTTTSIEERHFIYVDAATVAFANRVIPTGRTILPMEAGPGRAYQENHDYLIMDVSESHFQWSNQIAMLARDANIVHNGTARFVKADGALTVDGAMTSHERQLLTLNGTIEASLEPTSAFQSWSIHGNATFVAIDGIAVHEGNRAALPATAAIAGLAAFFIWWAGALHKAAGLVLGHREEDPLGNSTRAALARSLLRRPGQGPMDLARLHGVSRRTIRYHLGMLVAAGLVSEYRDGKIPRYALNSGSSNFPRGGTPSIKAFSAQVHPIRQRLIEVAKMSAINYETFSETFHEYLPESTFRFHCRILEKVGLFQPVKQGCSPAWQMSQDPQELHTHYVRAFLLRQGLWKSYERLLEGQEADARARRILERLGLIGETAEHIPAGLMAAPIPKAGSRTAVPRPAPP